MVGSAVGLGLAVVKMVMDKHLGEVEVGTLVGDVRELENLIHRAVVLARGPRITTGDLPIHLSGLEPEGDTDPAPSDTHILAGDIVDRQVRSIEQSRRRGDVAVARLLRLAARDRVRLPRRPPPLNRRPA